MNLQYKSIISLRKILPNHSYIQYTATPQANLFISEIDRLSPQWHVILEPGEQYCGGNKYFNSDYDIVDTIPREGNFPISMTNIDHAPKSLIDSIKEYFIISALMKYCKKGDQCYSDKSSMLIHPTWRVNDTTDQINNEITRGIQSFTEWTRVIVNDLRTEFDNKDFGSIASVYEKVKARLIKYDVLTPFPALNDISDLISDVADETFVEQVTGGTIDDEDGFVWEDTDHWILIGGQLLDRGFTVENLVLTYMPRDSQGKNQSDTIQQRCRFYGYRLKYLPFCRIYLTEGMKDDYIDYNRFENHLHSKLNTMTLNEFYLDDKTIEFSSRLLLTNLGRIADELVSTRKRKGWRNFNLSISLFKGK